MSEPAASLPPLEWVYKRDGRLAPFDADKIGRALFAASESLGQPDSFLARELSDSVVHFLAVEAEGTTPTTTQLAELAIKVVRELGHPTLAQAYEVARNTKVERSEAAAVPLDQVLSDLAPGQNSLALMRRLGAANLAPSFLRATFGRDIEWTHTQGLLTLTGLDAPLELAGWLLGKPPERRLVEFLEEARGLAGGYVAVDGPEYLLPPTTAAAAEFVRELNIGLRATGLQAVVNLNSALPPPWAGTLSEGPLFGGRAASSTHADELREMLGQTDGDHRVRVAWHLGERDFAAAKRDPLANLVGRALDGAAIEFAFDRPRRAVSLAEGIDRQHPAVLLAVHLDLARLMDMVERQVPEQRCPTDLFLRKLGSLARLALSAGVQKRAFLRRLQRSWPPFLLERARLLVVPTGLAEVVRRLGPYNVFAPPGLELARHILQQLADVLREEGRACQLEACLEVSCSGALQADTCSVPLLEQLKAAAALYKTAGGGTVSLIVPPGESLKSDEAIPLLQWAWRQTGFARLRFLRGKPDTRNS